MRVLVLDSSPIIQKIVKKNLVRLGINDISMTHDSGEALRYASNNKNINIFFIDHMNNKINGYHFLDNLKKQNPEHYQHYKIICVSSESRSEEIVKQYINRGVEDFIFKPFSLEDFNQIIIPVLEKEKKQKRMIVNTISRSDFENLIAGSKVMGKNIAIDNDELLLTLGQTKIFISLDLFLKNAHVS